MKTLLLEKLQQRITEHAEDELKNGKISGKEILVHQDGHEVFRGVFGHSSVGGETLNPNQTYRAASMTKPITATAVLQLADQGKLDLTAPVSDFYPAMKNLKVANTENGKVISVLPAKNTVRIFDLLSHTSGIGCAPLSPILNQFYPEMTLDEAVRIIADDPVAFEPGTKESYCPTNAFDLAAGIVEMISDMDFGQYLQKNIFEPLEMIDTTFAPSPEQFRRMVVMHARTADGVAYNYEMPKGCVFENYQPKRMAAGAALMITANDYIRFADMLTLGGTATNGARILSPDAVRKMRTVWMNGSIPMSPSRWGLGVRVVCKKADEFALEPGCFGWSGAYGTHYWSDPENKISVILLRNSQFDGGGNSKASLQLEHDVMASLI